MVKNAHAHIQTYRSLTLDDLPPAPMTPGDMGYKVIVIWWIRDIYGDMVHW